MSRSEALFRFKCRNLLNMDKMSKSDPKLILLSPANASTAETFIGCTETIKDNLNPVFEKTVKMPFFFEQEQQIEIRVVDVDGEAKGPFSTWKYDLLGSVKTTVGRIFGSRGKNKEFELTKQGAKKSCGTVHIFGEINEPNGLLLKLSLGCDALLKMDTFGKSDPFLTFTNMTTSTQVFKSEVHKKTLSPVFNPIEVPVSSLSVTGDPTEKFLVEVYDYDGPKKSQFMAQIEISADELVHSTGTGLALVFKPGSKETKKNKKSPGFLNVISAIIEQKIGMSVAVDFTLSNGMAHDPSSLHYDTDQQPSQYSRCINAIGNVLAPYDYDNSFPITGFGGNVPGIGVSHCFNLSNQPEVIGVEGMIYAYRTAIQQVRLYGPTNFAPTIKEAIHACVSDMACQEFMKYNVLVIITDGAITDLDETIAAIVEASTHPLSIVIVGVGSADFSSMDELDGDDGLLRSRDKVAARDIVQFVPFLDYEKNPLELAAHTLKEIPEQLEAFMALNHVKPRPPPSSNFQ